jgi:hypothetical protein
MAKRELRPSLKQKHFVPVIDEQMLHYVMILIQTDMIQFSLKYNSSI